MSSFFYDQSRQLLVYPRSDVIERYVPESKTVNGSLVAVPRTLRNCQTLRWLNYPVPPIITDENYDWPCNPGIKPWAHQQLAANYALLHPRSLNLSDLGSGKTLSLLWAADYLINQYPPGKCRVLIVAPLSTLQSVWASNIGSHFFGRRTFVVLHGSAEKRIELLKQDVDFYILNHDGVGIGAHTRNRFELDGFSKVLAERKDIKIAIIDEASAYKDATTKRHRIARLVFGTKEYLYLLTGTPTPQAPTEAYGLAKLINNAMGKSFTTFRLETMIKVSNFVWKAQRDGYEKARRLLTPAIRFDINDVWKDAPEMTIQSREVQLTAEQNAAMKRLKNELQIVVKSGQAISAVNEAAARSKFLQISLGAIYDSGHKVHFIDASTRMAVLKEVIEQSPKKILLLASFTSVLTLLEKELKDYHAVVVNGNTPTKQRVDTFRKFQEEAYPEIIIADPGVLAHGLNLQRGRTVIWYSPVDKGELFQQANKRCHRPGQSHPVSIIQIVSNPLEKEIYKRLANNATMQGSLLDLIRTGQL